MKADMTQVSVSRGQGLERRSGKGRARKVFFLSELHCKYYQDQRDKSYRALRYLGNLSCEYCCNCPHVLLIKHD